MLLRPHTPEEAKALKTVLCSMNFHTRPFIATISQSAPDDLSCGEVLGSGIYLEIRGGAFLVTNEHVAQHIQYRVLAHFLYEDQTAVRIDTPFFAGEPPHDVAITELSAIDFTKTAKAPFPSARVAHTFNPVEHELLFIHGFPGKKSYFSTSASSLISKSCPYLSQARPLPPNVDPRYFFAIHYPHKRVTRADGGTEDLPFPEGLSGSGVWDTRYVALQDPYWTPDKSVLVGLVFGYDSDNECLIAIKIEHVREFILLVLRQRAAYENWRRRGSPMDDDWTDWFASEAEIHTI